MSVITIVECEVCSNSFRIPAQSRPYEWDVPAHWLTVIVGNPQHQEGRHFCSVACLQAWAVVQEESKP